jgi:cytochrome c
MPRGKRLLLTAGSAMMHKYVLIGITLAFLGFLCVSNHSLAGNGEALFASLKCGACHKPDQKATAVSLRDIARAYQDQAKLVPFFKGDGTFIIESTRSGMMKGQMKHLEALSDEDKKALADYILSFK